jgi:hypothetical protein
LARFLAGAAACFLFVTGFFMLWQGRAQGPPMLPQAPSSISVPATTPSMMVGEAPAPPPEATAKTREQKRFSRVDKDKDGRIAREELFAPRRKAFAKLDSDGNGALSFDEWADKTVDKFAGADKDHSGWLTPVEYAVTAPPPPKKKRCAC